MKADFSKCDGLLPAIVQDSQTGKVLMLGYMNEEALNKTVESAQVTFFSRSKQRLWVKGETSGNFLKFRSYTIDCDGDAILIQAEPTGPTCHTGQSSCFGDSTPCGSALFFEELEKLIQGRRGKSADESYVASLFDAGVKKIAQKVVEEAGEVAIEAVAGDKERFNDEATDLLFHFLVLLAERGSSIREISDLLIARNK